jgi:hypothetical protein
MKANKIARGGEVLNQGGENTSNQRVMLIQLHTFKSLKNKNN